MNMLNMIGGAVGLPLVGLFLDWQWQGVITNGTRFYSLGDYQLALTLLPIVLFLSFLVLLPVKETYSYKK